MGIDGKSSLKSEVRKEILSKLRGQSPSMRVERSRRIQEKLISSGDFHASKTIMTYVSLPTEVDTALINEKALEMGKKLIVPFIDTAADMIVPAELKANDELVKGLYGIYVPKNGPHKVSLKEIDLIVVPAIAYDRKNMRMGRGKGYYDRFLAQAELSHAKTIGLAFSFQVIDFLPSGPHDRAVSLVLTD